MTKKRLAAVPRMALAASLAAACLLLIAPAASGHGAPPPMDKDTRLLHDHNDDCGGDGATSLCGGTHDLIALDAREAWDEALGHVIVFTFIMDQGRSGTLRDVLEFQDGGGHRLALETDDGSSYRGDYDRIAAPRSLGDGTRFALEATVARESIGLDAGATLRGFQVTAHRDGQRGDLMPGGYASPAGDVSDPPQGESPTNYRRPSWVLEGPVQYARMAVDPPQATLAVGDERLVTIEVENRLGDETQVFAMDLEAGAGVRARFHDPGSGEGTGYSDTYRLELPKGRSGFVHLAVEGTEPGATGTVRVTATSDQGARVAGTFAYGVGAPPPDPEDAPGGAPETKDTPAAGLLAFATVFYAAAVVRRR